MASQTTISFCLSILLLLAIVSFSPASAAFCNSADKKALLKIKSDLGDPYVLISWGTTGAGGCCGWPGVTCDSSNRVTDLHISQANTSTVIPASVAGLPLLTSLTFRKNPGLTGPIPPAIATLTKLTFLRLDWNALSGPIPPFLARLTSLDYLNLSFNKFSGTIPAFLAALPLSYINLSRNQFTGSLPSALAGSSSSYLYLSHNNLTGPFPGSFASTGFQVIDVGRNQLSGDASLLFGEKKPLQILDLDRNSFEFDLTKVVFPENLTSLDFDHNMVFGSIPESITKLELQFLNVSYNRLCGQIPAGGNLGRFSEYEFFHNKCLCGTPLPPCK